MPTKPKQKVQKPLRWIAEAKRIMRAFIDHGDCRVNPDADDYPKLRRDALKLLAESGTR